MDEDNDNVDPSVEMLNEGAPATPQQPVIDYQKLYEQQQAQMQQIVQQNAQLAQTVQQVANRPVVVPTNAPAPDPFADFEPGTAKALKAVIDRQNEQFKQQFAQQEQRFVNMALEQEAASIAATPGLTPDQVKRAQDIFRGNRAKGIPIAPSECIDVVVGQDFRAGRVNIGANQNKGTPPAVLTGGGRPPVPAKPKPANFDRMTRKQQIEYFESNEDLHNTPIQAIWDDVD